jgi:hypothetical protein
MMSADVQATPERDAGRRPSAAVRRSGYLIAILVNGAILYVVNVWPSWHAVPFLTSAKTAVLPWINASIIVGMVANAIYLFVDPRWLRAAGDVVTTAVGLAAMLQLWAVFPFALGPGDTLDASGPHPRRDRRSRFRDRDHRSVHHFPAGTLPRKCRPVSAKRR